ncbi:hypothetical protein PTSG_04531 [Salpingoeca rosetta]|uniref:Uncharacterized protein n=1 Tax=Salpingoeca rosetta (strain ATCC 50818 / BSB-021) TaxID=946362 RepID=F2U7Q0_SALR5|nr:uncharacterized protein PTSG_04531 [Salpingoeca rosetta]EGD72805.1 hypothetical protein PTSG_04531 [Salpingoeca rosetta]|eukprot:XP_004994628.1 hypothetical protein PTSG_04531 [Salpingoeca rosetta]
MESPLRVGIMSTAFIGKKTIQAIGKAAGAEVVGVASRSLEKAEAFAKEQGVSKAYGTYEEMLADANVQAVYIPLPTALRAEWVIKAAKAGKHILCEKPAATSLAELKEMIKACEDNQVLWMDGVMFMHHDRVQRVQEQVAKVGPATFVNSGFSFSGSDDFLSNDIRMSPDLEPFSALGDLGWYNIRATMMAYGWDIPARVSVHSHRNVDGKNLPSEVTATMVYGDERRATFHSSFHHAFRQTLDISGPNGQIVLDDFVLERTPEEVQFSVITDSGPNSDHQTVSDTTTIVTVKGCCQEQCMWERFARLVAKGKEASDASTNPLETWQFWKDVSLKTQAVLDACAASAKQDGAFVAVAL